MAEHAKMVSVGPQRRIAALAIATLALTTFPALAAPAGREGFQGGQRFSGGHPSAFEERHGFGRSP